MVMVNKEQRVGVFVDVQNMYYSARALYNAKVNFKEILKDAVNNRKLVRAIAYAVRAGEKEEENFHKALDGVVLISGDGDYIPLVEHLKRALGCRVEVMAFGRSCSGKLIDSADEFVDMDHNKKYILSKK